MNNELTTTKAAQFDLSPQTFDQAVTLSEYLANSTMVPKDFVGKPGNCLIAMQWGMEVGLKPLQALQGIAVINGRPSLWGDALLSLVLASPLCEYIRESDDGHTATCRAKRRGQPEEVSTFSMEEAKLAGLLGKAGPWTQYPKRMRQMRARAFRLRDTFPDVLKGMDVAEAVMDIPRDMGEAIPAGGLGSDWAPDDLDAGKAAAAKGAAAYGAFWKSLSAPEQARLVKTPEHAANKAAALKADSARTFDTNSTAAAPAPAAVAATGGPTVTFAQVMQKLVAAANADALDDAADWIGEVQDEVQRDELRAKYQDRQREMEGGAA